MFLCLINVVYLCEFIDQNDNEIFLLCYINVIGKSINKNLKLRLYPLLRI
jgi:hypothetical protein